MGIGRVDTRTELTHDSVSIAGGDDNVGEWIPCDGYRDVVCNLENVDELNHDLIIEYSTDAQNVNSRETVITDGSKLFKKGITEVGLGYFRVKIINKGGSVGTFSHYAYLRKY